MVWGAVCRAARLTARLHFPPPTGVAAAPLPLRGAAPQPQNGGRPPSAPKRPGAASRPIAPRLSGHVISGRTTTPIAPRAAPASFPSSPRCRHFPEGAGPRCGKVAQGRGGRAPCRYHAGCRRPQVRHLRPPQEPLRGRAREGTVRGVEEAPAPCGAAPRSRGRPRPGGGRVARAGAGGEHGGDPRSRKEAPCASGVLKVSSSLSHPRQGFGTKSGFKVPGCPCEGQGECSAAAAAAGIQGDLEP